MPHKNITAAHQADIDRAIKQAESLLGLAIAAADRDDRDTAQHYNGQAGIFIDLGQSLTQMCPRAYRRHQAEHATNRRRSRWLNMGIGWADVLDALGPQVDRAEFDAMHLPSQTISYRHARSKTGSPEHREAVNYWRELRSA